MRKHDQKVDSATGYSALAEASLRNNEKTIYAFSLFHPGTRLKTRLVMDKKTNVSCQATRSTDSLFSLTSFMNDVPNEPGLRPDLQMRGLTASANAENYF